MMLLILGARWSVVDRFGIDLPEWDQWDAEGLHMLLPWLQHRPILPELFTPHNEHYVVPTKLLNFALTLTAGQWDQRLESVVNAALPAILAAALLWWSREFLRPKFIPLLSAFLGVIWAAPLAWQNVIAGFHSQQFFLIVLAFITIKWLPFAPFGSWRWWLGAMASVAGLLTMASGFFAAAVALGIIVFRGFRRETSLRGAWPSSLIAALVCAAGWFTRHEVAHHASLRAANVHDFWLTVVQALQWPAPSVWFALVLWVPWLVLVMLVVSNRRSYPGGIDGWCLVGLGTWVLLQIFATAYARGAGGPPPMARYVDTLVFGAVVNVLSLGWLDSRFGRNEVIEDRTRRVAQPEPRTILCIYAAFWLLVFFTGATRVYHRAMNEELPGMGEKRKSVLVRARAYLNTRDIAYLDHPHVPYPGAAACADRLGRPEFEPFLPVSVRPPVTLIPRTDSSRFTKSDNVRPAASCSTAPFGVIPGVTIERTDDLPPQFRTSWSSFESRGDPTPAEWASATIPPPELRGWFLVPLAGDPSATFEFVSARSGESLTVLHPSTGDRWHATPVRAPSEPFYVRARTSSSGTWLGFCEPVSMSTLSFLAWQLCVRALFLMACGAIGLIGCGIGWWLTTAKNRTDP